MLAKGLRNLTGISLEELRGSLASFKTIFYYTFTSIAAYPFLCGRKKRVANLNNRFYDKLQSSAFLKFSRLPKGV